MASFAQRQLEKQGWQKGEGLGKNKTGITRAISISVKDDTNGLGANTDEWSNSWWDHCFNKTSANLNVVAAEDGGVVVTKVAKEKAEKKERKLLYGAFVKSGEKDEVEVEDKKDYSIKVSDAQLLAACEGRTARKGARGEQPGKLKRVLASSSQIPPFANPTVDEEAKIKKKVKKDKKAKAKRKEEKRVKKKTKRDKM